MEHEPTYTPQLTLCEQAALDADSDSIDDELIAALYRKHFELPDPPLEKET